MYLPEIYANLVTSAKESSLRLPLSSSLDERITATTKLSKDERINMLRDHPFMSARIFDKMTDLFFEHIINGTDKPLGDVNDYWIRVEFQERETPHNHCLISVNGTEELTTKTDNDELRKKLLDLIEEVTTANLL
jgi:hypothetical protein